MQRYKGSVLSGKVRYDDWQDEWFLMDEEINEEVCVTDLLQTLSEFNLLDLDSVYNGSILDLKDFYVNNSHLCSECKKEMIPIEVGKMQCGRCEKLKTTPSIKEIF